MEPWLWQYLDRDLELLRLMGVEDEWPADIKSTLELLCNADQLLQ
jgi:hypothetical protein